MLHRPAVWARLRHMIRFRPVLLAFCLMLPLAAPAKVPSLKPNLTLMADDSLMLALASLSRAYAQQEQTPLTIIRDDGTDPARRLEQGFDAHILLSADPTLVERLAQRGLIDVFGTKRFAQTQLALVAPLRMKQRLAFAKRISFAAVLFAQAELPVYIGPSSTPEGLRAQALMEGREFSHELSNRAQVLPSHEAVIEALRKQDGFALMLASDAITEPDVTILNLLPETTSEPVRYDAVVIASDSMEQARSFTKFLESPTAEEILAHYGFQPAK